MFATDCLSHFLSASLLTGPPVTTPDRKVKDTPLEPKWYISQSLRSKQESAGRGFSHSWIHVNVLITRRTDWKLSGRNWMSHRVVFIVISHLLTFTTHQWIIHDSVHFIGIWLLLIWLSGERALFLGTPFWTFSSRVRSFDQVVKTQMSSRESERGHFCLQLCAFDPNPASCNPGSSEQHEMMFEGEWDNH